MNPERRRSGYIKSSYRTIHIRFINSNDETIGYKPLLIPVGSLDNSRCIDYAKKKWNQDNKDPRFKAVMAEEVDSAKVVKQKTQYEQLTFF